VDNFAMSNEDEPTVPHDKKTLRRQLRAQRRSLAPQRDRSADADAIARAASTLVDTIVLSPSRAGQQPADDGQPCVAIYRSLPTEPPTRALAEMLHERNVTVIVPETLPDFDLEWHELLTDGSEGPRLGLEGISDAHLILTPALSVDRTGTRLGQGGGCYDRALARRRPDATIVAIVNDEEFAESPLPLDAHDVRVDAVITPAGGYCQIPAPGSVA
jgi:5-formyltetrahydrofolate cyclo-ligase